MMQNLWIYKIHAISNIYFKHLKCPWIGQVLLCCMIVGLYTHLNQPLWRSSLGEIVKHKLFSLNAGTVGASLISVGNLFKSRVARGRKGFMSYLIFVWYEYFVVSCSYKMTVIDIDLFLCSMMRLAGFQRCSRVDHCYSLRMFWHCLWSDSHFKHTLLLTIGPFVLYVWGVSAMDGIWLNNILNRALWDIRKHKVPGIYIVLY